MADTISTLIVQRGESAPTLASTPSVHMPDIIIEVMSPLAVVLVRALRVYLQTATGLITTGALISAAPELLPSVPGLLPAVTVLTSWKVACNLAVGPALICAAQNTIELLARLDERLPKLRP